MACDSSQGKRLTHSCAAEVSIERVEVRFGTW